MGVFLFMTFKKGYSKAPYTVWETDLLNNEEKYFLLSLIAKANSFGKEEEEFNLSFEEFKEMGFGRKPLERLRKRLIDLNLITYTRGYNKFGEGKSSAYKLNWIDIDNLPKAEKVKKKEIEEQQESGIMGTCLGTIEELEEMSASKKRAQTTVSVPSQKSEARRNYEEYMEGPTGMDLDCQYRAIQEAMRAVDHRIPSTAQTQRTEIYKEEVFGFDEWAS